MTILALLLAAQAVAVPAMPLPSAHVPRTPPQRIILSNCPAGVDGEIVVCGASDKPRLPLPDERGPPERPIPSNPDVSGIGALAQEATPCAATQWGCQVGIDIFGIGTAAGRLLGKLVDPGSCCERPGESTDAAMLIGDAVDGLKRAFRKKPDKSARVAISLDDPPRVSSACRLLP